MTTKPIAPVKPKERNLALDVLRGVALLGILLMNIQSFAMPAAAYFNPTAFGDLTGANRAAWTFSHIFADQKFMTIFSILYGAGIILITRKLEDRGQKSAGLHYRRTFWLLLIGLAHAYLLWYGDILVTYALVALVVFFLRKLSPRWLILLGILSLAVSTALQLFAAGSLQFFPPEQVAAFAEDWQPDAETVAWETAVYQGSYLDTFAHRVPASIDMNTFSFLFWGMWRAGGLMLVGMALFKLGVLTAQRSRRFYSLMALLGFTIGLLLVGVGISRNFAASWTLEYSRFVGVQWNYWGSLGVSLAYIALIMLAAKSERLRGLLTPFAAVGRTALSNYLFQTIVATTLFYGYGFGLFGNVSRLGQLLIVLSIWPLQVVLSTLWLRRFRFGLAEWLWRSLTYGRVQPLRSRPAPVGSAA